MIQKKVLLILPAFNEMDSILDTISTIENFHTNKFLLDYIVINDGSTDETKKILETNKKKAIHLVSNLGIGGAVQTGYKFALENKYDIAVQFDGDGQHDINSLEKLIQPILSNEVDFSSGSRFIPGKESSFKSTIFRRIGINIISFLIKLVGKIKIFDTTSGFRAANSNVIEFFANDYPVKYPEPESLILLIKKGYKFKEIPVNMFERTGGASSITPLKSVRYMLEVSCAILFLSFKKEEGN